MKFNNNQKSSKGKKKNHHHVPSMCQVVKPEIHDALFNYILFAHKVYIEKVSEEDFDYIFTLQYTDQLVLQTEKVTNNVVDFVSSKFRFIANWDKLGIYKNGANNVLLDFMYKDENGNSKRFISKIEILNAELDKDDSHKIKFNIKQNCGDDLHEIVKEEEELEKIKNVHITIR